MFPSTPKINPATSVDISWLLRSGLWSAASAMWQQLLIFTPCSRVHTDHSPMRLLSVYDFSLRRVPYYYVCLVLSVPISASVLSNAYLEISPTLPIPACQRDECQRSAEKPEAQINEWRLQRSSTKPGGGWWLVAGGVLVTRCKECWANCYKWCMGWVCRLQLGRLGLLQHCRYPLSAVIATLQLPAIATSPRLWYNLPTVQLAIYCVWVCVRSKAMLFVRNAFNTLRCDAFYLAPQFTTLTWFYRIYWSHFTTFGWILKLFDCVL